MATCRSYAQYITPLTRDFCVLMNDQNGPKVSRIVALVKFGHMLENPVYPMGTRRDIGGSENPKGAENQQERLVRSEPESSETYTPDIDPQIDEDKVRAAWRHAGWSSKEATSWFAIRILGRSITCPSEIPCRVSNIAQGSGDTTPMTGSNRWNPNGACTGASKGNTEGKIRGKRLDAAPFPRNDSGCEIPGWRKP